MNGIVLATTGGSLGDNVLQGLANAILPWIMVAAIIALLFIAIEGAKGGENGTLKKAAKTLIGFLIIAALVLLVLNYKELAQALSGAFGSVATQATSDVSSVVGGK